MKLDNVFGKDIPKFIQIVTGQFDLSHSFQQLFALDSEGQLWELTRRSDGKGSDISKWKRIEAERMP